jgi:xylulose-5-phosphate/fructose-6-phosphate phosphoketolase
MVPWPDRRHDKTVAASSVYMMGARPTWPGHGGPGLVAQTYLEGSYTERYPAIERSRNGLHRLFRQFSWPYGIPSHVAPETPGSIHEGGELGYSLAHAYGAAFDNPDLIVACVIGDGEAETGALAASWHSNKFLNPVRDGAVLPILHLNGFKIANPTLLARIPRQELTELLRGYGYDPHFVEGDDPAIAHQSLAGKLDTIPARIRRIQRVARARGEAEDQERPCWPMIVFRTPKGWTGPKFVDGQPVEGTWRAHQVPIADFKNPDHLRQPEEWMKSYQRKTYSTKAANYAKSSRRLLRRGIAAWAAIRTPTVVSRWSHYRCPTSAITRSMSLPPERSGLKRRAIWGSFFAL